MAGVPFTNTQMTRHYNPTIAIRAQRILNTRNGDMLPEEVSGPVATIEIRPSTRNVIQSSESTSSTTNTITTFASDRDTYITGIHYSIIKDAACDAADSTFRVQGVFGGAIVPIVTIPYLTLTAQSVSGYVAFPYPLRVDRGSTLQTAQTTFTAGKFRRAVNVHTYTEDVTSSDL